ncbi:hypothetical protein GCM10010210_15680 [Pseudonocardia hydrocarbonoxydans]|uniref:Uncharacterized protein n=1 Tax=Pseudonocardia hydrocarbonoxydans TaxID=76726 RepID=A0A4Y3WTW3_9PSEU|nr:hypothetical protein PHY01_34720 [Pseudonocardia hydrocarbonoxydans]
MRWLGIDPETAPSDDSRRALPIPPDIHASRPRGHPRDRDRDVTYRVTPAHAPSRVTGPPRP